MRFPIRQPQRALMAALLYVLVAGTGALALMMFFGFFLGGVSALMWLAALTVPTAVLAHRPARP